MTSESLSSAPPQFQLLEVCVDGPAPLGALELPITRGLSALYGLNGAGKTRLLDSLRSIARGERPGAQVIVWPRDEASTAARIGAAHQEWLGDVEPTDLEEQFGPFPWRHQPRSALESVLGDVLIEQWALTETWPLWGSEDHDRPPVTDVVEEVLRSMRLVLRLSDSGFWHLGIAVRFGEDTPLLAGLRQRIDDSWNAAVLTLPPDIFDDDEDRDPESFAAEGAAVEQFSQRLSFRDFFTVLGPLPLPDYLPDYGDALGNLMEAGALVYITTVCRDVATGPLCELRTDDDLLAFTDLSSATTAAIRTWGHRERLAALERDGATKDEMYWASHFGSSLSMIESNGSEVRVAGWVTEPLGQLVEAVNLLLESMLPDPPALECTVLEPDRWADSEPCRWSATDLTGARVELHQLSGAQTRLVRLAFSLALDGYQRQFRVPEPADPVCTPALILLDEPEAGLHRLAEDSLTQGLHEYGRRSGAAVLAATHSSSFLRNPDLVLVEVFRREGGSTGARRVEFPDQAGVDALGISRADLLQLYQLILLVEGHHEQLVFGEMLGRELGRRRALPVPLRGSFNLNAIVDLEILAHTLEQPVLAVLDNANSEAIDHLWAELKALPEGSGVQDARPVFEKCLGPVKDRTDEEKQIASLAENLLKSNQLDRFEVYGLKRGDIIEYLPVERLVPGSTSWEELREEHEQAKNNTPGKTAKDFKKWLAATHHADFGDDAILLAAAVTAEAPPDEFLLLLSRIDSIVDGWTR